MLSNKMIIYIVLALFLMLMNNKTREGMEMEVKDKDLSNKNYALVLVNPVNEYFSEKAFGYNAYSDSFFANKTIDNIENILKYCEDRDIDVYVSKRSYTDHDLKWRFGGYMEHHMLKNKMFMSEFSNSIYEGFKDKLDNAIMCEDFKLYAPNNDLMLQLRKRGIKKVYLAGMAANMEVDSHMRSLIENGFEVIVIKDATAGSVIDLGNGYTAALTNFGYMANEVISTVKFLDYFPKQNSVHN